jgi:pyruvate dehydrogenase E2 component (dihydrolipoamide acetyltransferase)
VSPLARRMAQQASLDLASLMGTGPHGRIVKADIDATLGKAAHAAPSVAAPAPASVVHPTAAIEVPHNAMRKIIARRLVESKQTIPHIYLTIDCEIDELLKLRKTLNDKAADGAYKISINDFIVRAVALALRKVPRVNASWTDTAILLHDSADVAVAVALDDGLITPIIRNADGKGLAEISNETKELAGRARAGKLMPDEYQGGTFSVSNLGMFGTKSFSAVINPPHAAILAVGAGAQQAVVKDGALAVATVMSCTISADHRVIDGAVAAEFLAVFKSMVDDPLNMLL